MDTSELVPVEGMQDSLDSQVIVSGVLGKLGYIIREIAEQRDLKRDAIRLIKASMGFLIALALGFLYYVAFMPILSQQLGCDCGWDEIYEALGIVIGILLLALWPALKFSRS